MGLLHKNLAGIAAVVLALVLTTPADAQVKKIYRNSDPVGSEPERTTHDPGWWQRTFVGVDANGDGKMTGGERGILLLAWDAITSIFDGVTEWVFAALWSVLPEALLVDMAPLAQYFRIVNLWLPFDYMLSLVMIYYTFLAGLTMTKLLLVAWHVIRG